MKPLGGKKINIPNNLRSLRDIFLFRNLKNEELKELERFSFLTEYAKGEVVFLEGDAPKYLHILLKGVAKVYRIDPEGRELVIHRFKGISLIAEMANIKGVPFPANCIMETDGLILKIDFQRFQKFLTHKSVCLEIISSLLGKINLLYELIEDNFVLDTETRIAKFIYENPHLLEVEKAYKIAEMLRIRPETLSRKLKRFKQLGIIERKGKKFVVKNRELLRKFYSW